MITIKINGKAYGFDKEEVEQVFSESGIEKIKDADFGGKKSMFNSLIGSTFMMIGIKKPKEADGMDNMEFASRIALHTLLSQLDGQTIELTAKEVNEDGKE